MRSKGNDAPAKPDREEIKARNIELFGSKIRSLREKAGLSSAGLAKALNISRSSVQNWECGLTRPDPGLLYRMFFILDAEPNDFFGIKGVGGLLSDRERSLISDYRSLDERGRQDLEMFAKTMSEKAHERSIAEVLETLTFTPSFGRFAAAGTSGTEWPDHPEREDVILFKSPAVSRADEIITVSGESMEPQFHDGDRVLVEYCADLKNGDIGIFYVRGTGGVIKQKAYDRLHSLNPEHDDIFPYEEGAELIGRVLSKIDESMIPPRDRQLLFMEAVEEKRHGREFAL